MKKCAKYTILPEHNLLIECYNGQIHLVDAFNLKKNELSDKLFNPNYSIIVDFRNFDSVIDSSSINSISRFFSYLKKLRTKSKVAFLTTKPNQVIIGEIFKELCKDLSIINFEIFSTLEAAIKYVDCSYDSFSIIKEKIRELNVNTY